jgi:hypothetical protein
MKKEVRGDSRSGMTSFEDLTMALTSSFHLNPRNFRRHSRSLRPAPSTMTLSSTSLTVLPAQSILLPTPPPTRPLDLSNGSSPWLLMLCSSAAARDSGGDDDAELTPRDVGGDVSPLVNPSPAQASSPSYTWVHSGSNSVTRDSRNVRCGDIRPEAIPHQLGG